MCAVCCGTLKTPRVYVQNIPVCTGTGRFERAHGDVLNVHTGSVLDGHTGRGVGVCLWWRGEGGQRDTPTSTQCTTTTTQRATNKRTTHNTEHARWHRQFCSPKFAHLGLPLGPRGPPKKTLGSYTFSSLRKGREQHVSDSSNHSVYLMKLLRSSYLEGNCGGSQL